MCWSICSGCKDSDGTYLFPSGLEWFLWNTNRLHCTGSFPLAAHFPAVGHTRITLRVTQRHNSSAHSSHASAASHTVDSRSSAEVINDFLWPPSNSPSIANPLFLVVAPLPPFLSPSLLLERTARRTCIYNHRDTRRWPASPIILLGSTKFRRYRPKRCSCPLCASAVCVEFPGDRCHMSRRY